MRYEIYSSNETAVSDQIANDLYLIWDHVEEQDVIANDNDTMYTLFESEEDAKEYLKTLH